MSQRPLVDLDAEWGPSESEWRAIADLPPNWITRQNVFCLISRYVTNRCVPVRSRDLPPGSDCRKRAELGTTPAGIAFVGPLRCRHAPVPIGLARGESQLESNPCFTSKIVGRSQDQAWLLKIA